MWDANLWCVWMWGESGVTGVYRVKEGEWRSIGLDCDVESGQRQVPDVKTKHETWDDDWTLFWDAASSSPPTFRWLVMRDYHCQWNNMSSLLLILMRRRSLHVRMEFRPFVFIAIHHLQYEGGWASYRETHTKSRRAYDSIFGGEPSLLLGSNVSGLLFNFWNICDSGSPLVTSSPTTVVTICTVLDRTDPSFVQSGSHPPIAHQ